MNKPAHDQDWHAVRERLNGAAQAIAFSSANLKQHQAAAMQARTRELARIPPETGKRAELLELVTFRLSGESYALEARFVYEVMQLPQVTIVPRTPESLLGVINLRGEILAVFDFNRLFGLQSNIGEHTSRLIVLGESHPQFGFVADAVEQVKTIDPAELRSPAAPFASIRREVVCGVTADALVILNGQVLLDDERLIIEQQDDGTGD